MQVGDTDSTVFLVGMVPGTLEVEGVPAEKILVEGIGAWAGVIHCLQLQPADS